MLRSALHNWYISSLVDFCIVIQSLISIPILIGLSVSNAYVSLNTIFQVTWLIKVDWLLECMQDSHLRILHVDIPKIFHVDWGLTKSILSVLHIPNFLQVDVDVSQQWGGEQNCENATTHRISIRFEVIKV